MVIRMTLVHCCINLDLWDLHDQGQGQCDSGGRVAAWHGHACCGILHLVLRPGSGVNCFALDSSLGNIILMTVYLRRERFIEIMTKGTSWLV
ncbi:hypothetical protein PVAP13_8KG315000 [Panicum virgatum]|uniref:Uncharacterized protein n=1 Tax=Panicum virgatum TaxID=38727 RepID=A0A8T0PN05_PANVG|nr:hypothetical protein PVAP13_8KG315000 [Panicum virgatum]